MLERFSLTLPGHKILINKFILGGSRAWNSTKFPRSSAKANTLLRSGPRKAWGRLSALCFFVLRLRACGWGAAWGTGRTNSGQWMQFMSCDKYSMIILGFMSMCFIGPCCTGCCVMKRKRRVLRTPPSFCLSKWGASSIMCSGSADGYLSFCSKSVPAELDLRSHTASAYESSARESG